MWTDEQRKRTDARGVLQSDMMDAGWSELGPLIPDAAPGGRPRMSFQSSHGASGPPVA